MDYAEYTRRIFADGIDPLSLENENGEIYANVFHSIYSGRFTHNFTEACAWLSRGEQVECIRFTKKTIVNRWQM